jgi:hypothetical protein
MEMQWSGYSPIAAIEQTKESEHRSWVFLLKNSKSLDSQISAKGAFIRKPYKLFVPGSMW